MDSGTVINIVTHRWGHHGIGIIITLHLLYPYLDRVRCHCSFSNGGRGEGGGRKEGRGKREGERGREREGGGEREGERGSE